MSKVSEESRVQKPKVVVPALSLGPNFEKQKEEEIRNLEAEHLKQVIDLDAQRLQDQVELEKHSRIMKQELLGYSEQIENMGKVLTEDKKRKEAARAQAKAKAKAGQPQSQPPPTKPKHFDMSAVDNLEES